MKDNWLFKVCHKDGRKWTREEVNEYIDEKHPNSILYEFYCFVIDDEGCLLYCDKCGNYEYFINDDVKIVWNNELIK